MKNTRKKTISEAAAEAMGLSGYPLSNNASDKDMTGRGSMIPSPVVA